MHDILALLPGTASPKLKTYYLFWGGNGEGYLVSNGFAHEEGGNVKWQHILKQELVDILHGLHLLSLHLKTAIQQEVHPTPQLVLERTKWSTFVR